MPPTNIVDEKRIRYKLALSIYHNHPHYDISSKIYIGLHPLLFTHRSIYPRTDDAPVGCYLFTSLILNHSRRQYTRLQCGSCVNDSKLCVRAYVTYAWRGGVCRCV